MRAPIIVCGMHRSGTTMVARHLRRAGVFMGHFRDGNEEALFFLRRNQRLFRSAGARWDHPTSVDEMLADPDRLRAVSETLAGEWRSWRAVRYLGLRARDSVTDGPWGFKDPRTLFTAPVWNRVLGEAHFVVVLRDGVDVAFRLRARERRPGRRLRSREPSTRCLDLRQGFALWGEYAGRAVELARRHDPAKIHPVRYEDYVADAEGALSRLLARLGIECEPDVLRSCAGEVDPVRSISGGEPDEVAELRREAVEHPLMTKFGYGGER